MYRFLMNAVVVSAIILVTACLTAQAPERQYFNDPGRSDDLPFSHAVLAGNTLYLAGTIGIDPATGAPPEDVRAEARIAMDSIKRRLALAGMTMDNLVSVQIFCPDLSLYEDFNEVYRSYFNERFPARAFIGSGPLLRGGRFEVNAIAVK